MSTPDLLSCPFCGDSAYVRRWVRGFWPVAEHVPGCPMRGTLPPATEYFETEADAAAAWSLRAGCRKSPVNLPAERSAEGKMMIPDFDFSGRCVFLSGPMTGIDDWNRAAFADAERAVRAAGAGEVFNPAADAPAGEDTRSHAYWMLRTLRELTRADRRERDGCGGAVYYDAIALLPGWEYSEGATVEAIVAGEIGMEVVEL